MSWRSFCVVRSRQLEWRHMEAWLILSRRARRGHRLASHSPVGATAAAARRVVLLGRCGLADNRSDARERHCSMLELLGILVCAVAAFAQWRIGDFTATRRLAWITRAILCALGI